MIGAVTDGLEEEVNLQTVSLRLGQKEQLC